MAVYKSIMSGGGRSLFFALVDDKTDRVETIDLKKWLKANVRDNSSKDSKERVIKAILRNQKQFNKKVDFNMWAKKTKPSFEQTMDYFMKNGFVSNITKKGIKVYEGVEVNEASKPSIKVVNKFEPKEGIQIMAVKTLDGKTHFGGMVQRGRFSKIIPFGVNQSKSDVQKRGLQIYDELEKDESVNEGKKRFYQQDNIGSSKYTINYHDGKSKNRDGSDFYGIKIFKNKKDLETFRKELLKKGYREDSGSKNESVNEDKKQIKDLVKTTKHEKLFYDVLSTMEKKYGKSNYGKWLDKSLKDFGENPSKYRTSADKEEKLFQLGGGK